MMRYSIRSFQIRLEVHEPPGDKVIGPDAGAALARSVFRTLDSDQEHFVAFFLDSGLRVTGMKVLFSGGLNSSIVDPKVLFRSALLAGAHRVLVAHNHASNDPTPSMEDRLATKKLVQAGVLIDVGIADHVIVAEKTHYSFAENGQL